MHLVWMVDDETPLTRAACELAIRTLAERFGSSVPDDAVVLVQPEGMLSGYPLSQMFAQDGTSTWAVDYRALSSALYTLADNSLRKAGLDPTEPTFERQARRLLRRRFAHWPEEQMQELLAVLPRIQSLAYALDEDDPDNA